MFKKQEKISLKAAVRELNSKGIKCYHPNARAFIRRMAEEIEQHEVVDLKYLVNHSEST